MNIKKNIALLFLITVSGKLIAMEKSTKEEQEEFKLTQEQFELVSTAIKKHLPPKLQNDTKFVKEVSQTCATILQQRENLKKVNLERDVSEDIILQIFQTSDLEAELDKKFFRAVVKELLNEDSEESSKLREDLNASIGNSNHTFSQKSPATFKVFLKSNNSLKSVFMDSVKSILDEKL